MGILIGIVVVFIVGLIVLYGLGGMLAFGMVFAGDKSKKKAEANAPAILDKAFVGEDVVFKINMESPKYETVVLGAKARGYRLMNETNNTASGDVKTLIFEKAT
ncbi:hypothetical protein [Pseudarthrobacter sp. S9]|uniref:hypothetical protein n=1 Tax=Pseudarthrobacter sp. S9 TaxID=3418421 RepID=UPI003D07AA97